MRERAAKHAYVKDTRDVWRRRQRYCRQKRSRGARAALMAGHRRCLRAAEGFRAAPHTPPSRYAIDFAARYGAPAAVCFFFVQRRDALMSCRGGAFACARRLPRLPHTARDAVVLAPLL